MLEGKETFTASDILEDPVAFVNGGDGSMVLDHEIVFVSSSPAIFSYSISMMLHRSMVT